MNAIGIVIAFAVLFPLVLGLLVLGLLWRAWWLYPAWGWFVVPLGLPPLSYWHFTAIVFLVGVLTNHVDTKKDERATDWVAIVVLFFWPILAWALMRWMRGGQ